MIDREYVRGTNIYLEEKLKQFNPCIYSGIIDFSPGYSKYFTSYGDMRSYKGIVPKLIPSEENREALRQGVKFFQNNEEFKVNELFNQSKSILDTPIGYADTAGLSTFPFKRKKSLKSLKIEEIYDIIKRS